MQLVAYGAQDVYLTGSPSITFFKSLYRRHTSFATESIEQTWNGSVDYGRKISCTISRNGDLCTTAYLEVTLKKTAGDTSFYPAEQIISELTLELGGQVLDKLYGDWYRIYDELFRTGTEKEAYQRMTNFETGAPTGQVRRFFIPLIFYWNRNPGLAIPLIALQYHEIKLHLTLATAAEMATNGIDTTVAPTVALWITYVFLDAEERRRFAQTSHEYLITQTQFSGAESIAPDAVSRKTNNVRLNYNHPCKFIVWAAKKPGVHGKFTTGVRGTTNDAFAPLYEAKLTLNGHDRFAARKSTFFNQVTAYETLQSKPAAGIYLYSFSLKPADIQPSGSCNFSRIDNATLVLTWRAGSVAGTETNFSNVLSDDVTLSNVTELTNLNIYAESYNVLRVMSGMGGLAYSN